MTGLGSESQIHFIKTKPVATDVPDDDISSDGSRDDLDSVTEEDTKATDYNSSGSYKNTKS